MAGRIYYCTVFTTLFMLLGLGAMVGEAQAKEPLVIVRTLTEEEFQRLQTPPEEYQDEAGACYHLERWTAREMAGEAVLLPMEAEEIYYDVEGAEQLPHEIAPEAEEAQGDGQETLTLERAIVLREGWAEDLRIPVQFEAYGADEYQLGDVSVKGGYELEDAAKYGEALLSQLSLPLDAYQITSLVWDGESYQNENGEECRKALALGRRLLRDYKAIYTGMVWQEGPPSYELEIVYRPQPDTAQKEAGPVGEDVKQEEGSRTIWYWIRSSFVIVVALGLAAVLLGLLILFVLYLRRKRREKESNRLPEIRR